MLVQCIKGNEAAGLSEGCVYEVALVLPTGTIYKMDGVEKVCTEPGYVLNSKYYPYVWDSSRFEILPCYQ